MTYTKRINGIVLVFVFSMVAFCFCAPSVSAEEEDIWAEDDRGGPIMGDPFSKENVDRFLQRLAETDPDKAKELSELREKDPEKFKEQFGVFLKEMRSRMPGGPEGPGPGEEGRRREARGGGPGPGRGEEGRSRWREHMQRMHEEYLEWLGENFPEEAERLKEIQEQKPDEYFRAAMESGRVYGPIKEAQKNNPELAAVLKEDIELKKFTDELLSQIQNAKKDKRKKMEAQLKEVVERRFDLIVRKKELRYEQLEERLKRLQEEIKEQKAKVQELKESKEQSVEQRMKDLLGHSEKVNWE